MATIKSYTDLEQSKKLAEILPLESADMCYPRDAFAAHYDKEPICHYNGIGLACPCWSLTALLKLIPNPVLRLATTDCWKLVWGIGEIDCDGEFEDFGTVDGNTPVDAAYNTIVYLIEQGYIKTEKN